MLLGITVWEHSYVVGNVEIGTCCWDMSKTKVAGCVSEDALVSPGPWGLPWIPSPQTLLDPGSRGLP